MAAAATAEEEVGREEEVTTLIEILEPSSGPINISRYVDHVRDSGAGAIATFEGTTRDTFEGKRVVELRYEAYVPMASRRLRSICSAARSTWSLRRVAVAHRLGTVPVGEASVFVAVSAVHRADALEACRYVIDEVKASVPIWKKEVYEGGEVWKENSEFFPRRRSGNWEMLPHNAATAAAVAADKLSSCCCGSKEWVGCEEPVHDSIRDEQNLGTVKIRRPSDGDAMGDDGNF